MTTLAVPVTEQSQVAEVRRRASAVAAGLGFDEAATGRVAIVATELASNIVKYGAPGEILVGSFDDGTGYGVELIALDKGSGVPDLRAAMRDGHSTGGSAGTGLGAVRRQSAAFDLISWPGRGTAVLARIKTRPTEPHADLPPCISGLAVPIRGETVCGDAFASRRDAEAWTVMLADGLGHGPAAAQASGEAVRLFHGTSAREPADILTAIHNGLRHTRGGAVSVARYHPDRDMLAFAGIGNVAGTIISTKTRRTVSLPGTAGVVARAINVFEYPFPPDALFVMCSDGIGTSWTPDSYPGLTQAHPSLLAGVIYRDFSRGRDDASILVARARDP